MDPSDPPAYLHGTDPGEQARLVLMNDLLNTASLRELGLGGGERILDLGCGLGLLARGMARAAGSAGRVIGIERSPEQIAEAERLARRAGETGRVEFRLGDALDPPLAPGEWGGFDVAHARFLLEHVTRPEAVVATMVRAVRPGGRVVLTDDDHATLHLHPVPAGFPVLWEAYVASFQRIGCDPFVGRRLVELLAGSGARPHRTASLFYGSCPGSPAFAGIVENLCKVIRTARDPILGEGRLDARGFETALDAIARWARLPHAAVWYGIPWAEGRRPG
jgi:SAM-dependent methyltransferase